MHFGTGGFCSALAILVMMAFACGESADLRPSVQFVDVARSAGIDFVHYHGATGEYYYPETYGSGAGFFDYDGDGWLDVYLVNGAPLGSGPTPDPLPVNQLYHNRGDGTFADVTASTGAGDPGYGMGCAAADYDNDGDQDLYVANFGPNAMYRNAGDGTFSEVTAQLGVGDPRWSSSCGFLDHDMDGDLDLFVANYVVYSLATNPVCQKGSLRSYCDPDAFTPIGDVLYRNDGDTFTDITAEAGLDLVGRGLGVAFQDYDEDGDTDIYVANDGTMNFLYENVGGRFQDRGLQSGTRFNMNGRAEAGMGVDFGDFDRDGLQDIVVGNFAYETTTLYHNTGGGQFVDASQRLGIGAVSYMLLSFGVKFIDYDNDGDLDIFAANGHVLDNIDKVDPAHTYAQPCQMLQNRSGQHFEEISSALGPDFTRSIVARGTATGDYDNDGDIDILINTTAGPCKLLRNDGGNQRHWLTLDLEGISPRDAVGARVTVTAGGVMQKRQRQGGSSYQATHDPRLHFGLGDAERADVEIIWPDGGIQHLKDVPANQILRVVQKTPQVP